MIQRHTLERMYRAVPAALHTTCNSSQQRSMHCNRRLTSRVVGTGSRSHSYLFTSAPTDFWRLHSRLPTTRCISSSPFTKPSSRKRRKFVPRKAAVELTEQARTFFKALLENNPQTDGIILNYQQASSGQPRMVFSFGFVNKNQLTDDDEGVSLELLEDGKPKSPRDSIDDGLPKLYIHHNAFLKVLGATLDVNTETVSPILYDREGNIMDPNA